MERKILIAVDGSKYSENAVRYAAEIAETQKEMTFTLFHVQPTISQYLLDEAKKRPGATAEVAKLMHRNDDAARQLLGKHKEQMLALNVAEAAIQLATEPRRFGVAKDILEYSMAGSYDAVLMGRRGLSGLEELFIGSASANVVENSEYIPAWLVDDRGASKSIMVAVDGSESSMRAVDHLAFMISGDTQVNLSFFHVTPRLGDFCPVDFTQGEAEELEGIIRQSDKECIDRFFSHALMKLKKAGIQEHRIDVHQKEGALRVGKAVLDAYRQGGFGTLVVGRRGMNKKFFTGSVSRYLINQFSKGALWVVP